MACHFSNCFAWASDLISEARKAVHYARGKEAARATGFMMIPRIEHFRSDFSNLRSVLFVSSIAFYKTRSASADE